MRNWGDEIEPKILMKVLNISRFVIKQKEVGSTARVWVSELPFSVQSGFTSLLVEVKLNSVSFFCAWEYSLLMAFVFLMD